MSVYVTLNTVDMSWAMNKHTVDQTQRAIDKMCFNSNKYVKAD